MRSGKEKGIITYGRSVPETHRHHAPLIRPKRCSNSCFVDVIGMHFGLEKAIGHVNGSPDLTFSTVCQNVINPG